MDHKSTAIVLHTVKYGDSGMVVKTFTREEGPLTYMARGVRGKRKKANLFQPLTVLEISGRTPKTGSMLQVREASIHTPFSSLPFDIMKRSVGMFIAEILYKSLKEEQPNEPLFDYILRFLVELDTEDWRSDRHFDFLANYAEHLGIKPETSNDDYIYFDLREGCFSGLQPHHPDFLKGEEAICFSKLSRCNEPGVSMTQMTSELRRKMLNTWVNYFRLHLDGIGEIKSHKVLETVLR